MNKNKTIAIALSLVFPVLPMATVVSAQPLSDHHAAVAEVSSAPVSSDDVLDVDYVAERSSWG